MRELTHDDEASKLLVADDEVRNATLPFLSAPYDNIPAGFLRTLALAAFRVGERRVAAVDGTGEEKRRVAVPCGHEEYVLGTVTFVDGEHLTVLVDGYQASNTFKRDKVHFLAAAPPAAPKREKALCDAVDRIIGVDGLAALGIAREDGESVADALIRHVATAQADKGADHA